MKISDLKPKQGNVDIIVEIQEINPAREFAKFGKTGRVANAIAVDESGQITMSLWNEQIDSVHAGDKIHIHNGYVNEWQGDMQLTTGRLGTFEVVSSGSKPLKDEDKKEDLPGKKPETKKREERAEGETEEDNISVDEEEFEV